jgi:proline iminopeptidase
MPLSRMCRILPMDHQHYAASAARRGYYPEIVPYRRGRLHVSHLHELYFEECGNPKGKPAVVLHGGPGGGISPFLRRMHDPARYRIILFDQRGCGNSTPHACLEDNTTWDLVADMEKLRRHLAIERWQVLGGSWGSTLAMAYAQMHAARVTELILRSVFAVRERELKWFYGGGAGHLFPEAYERFLAPIPAAEHGDIIAAYYQRLTGSDEDLRLLCARAWSQWEGATLSLLPDAAREASFAAPRFAIAFASIECHYFHHKGFFAHDAALLDNVPSMAHLPGVIIQGRYDVVTPAETAHELARRWPAARFAMVPDAGHTATEPGLADRLVAATDYFATGSFTA